jgi:hypothetical protein
MKNKLISSRWTAFAALLALAQQSAAFEIPLTDIAVREAYFLGQRNDQKTADFLMLYALLFLFGHGPLRPEIHLLTPYAQVVTTSAAPPAGAQQVAADYHGRGDLSFSGANRIHSHYTYDHAGRTAVDTAANSIATSIGRLQAFRFTLAGRSGVRR